MALHRLVEKHVGIYEEKYGPLPDVLAIQAGEDSAEDEDDEDA